MKILPKRHVFLYSRVLCDLGLVVILQNTENNSRGVEVFFFAAPQGGFIVRTYEK